jgi:hypothetical protein
VSGDVVVMMAARTRRIAGFEVVMQYEYHAGPLESPAAFSRRTVTMGNPCSL